MSHYNFNITTEWEFIYQESLNKSLQVTTSSPLIKTRELLLKAQIVLGKYELEENIHEKQSLLLEYVFIKNFYLNSLNGGLN